MSRGVCRGYSSTGEPGLPPPTPEAVALLLRAAPGERAAFVDYQVDAARLLAGPVNEIDETEVRRIWEVSFDRAFDRMGVLRQLAAISASPPRHERLRSLRVPTLVIHGDRDPLVPFACGEATAAAIPGAALMAIADMGHEIPERDRPAIVAAIRAHTLGLEGRPRAAVA